MVKALSDRLQHLYYFTVIIETLDTDHLHNKTTDMY